MIELDAVLLRLGVPPDRGKERWLHDALARAVVEQALPGDARLPGARRLADALGLARGTVTRALDALVDEGLLVTRPRLGYLTRPARRASRPAPVPAASRPPDKSPGVGDLSLFPRTEWRRALRHAVDTVADAELGYPSGQGYAGLRDALAGHLTRVRGADTDPSRIVVVSGAAQGLTILARAAAAMGQHLWRVEAPAPVGMVQLLEHHGARVERLPVDGEGVVPPSRGAPPALTLVTPSEQAPTGARLSPARRAALLEQAVDGGYVVEDDYDGDLPSARDRTAVMQGSAPDAVFLMGSVSKTIAPGLRLGWMSVPEAWVEALVVERTYLDLGSPVLEQAALAHFIATGGYDRYLRRVRPVYAERRDALVAALRAHGITTTGRSGAGLHVFLPMPAADAVRVSRVLDALAVPATSVVGPPYGVSVGCARILPHRAEEIARALTGHKGAPQTADRAQRCTSDR